MQPPLIVLKFGSSVLADPDCLPEAAHEVYRYFRRGYRVLAVVSAIGRHTDDLLDEARAWLHPPAPPAAVAELLATGEQRSAALFVMALHRAGIHAALLNLAESGLTVSGDRLDALPARIDKAAIEQAFATSSVLVMPGFAGIHETGGTALMGRGGSDLSAIFLAQELGAQQCRLVKDVDGIYERDPAAGSFAGNPPHRYGDVTYDEALRVSVGLVQPKALEYLRARQGQACVAGLLLEDGTHVGAAETSVRDRGAVRPLRVLLLGFGHVGQGVYRHLERLGNFFETVGILVRDLHKPRDIEARAGLLSVNLEELLARPHDLVVDVSAGPEMALAVAERSLAASRPVVTASKRIVAEHGDALHAKASGQGTRFRHSAAVGGAVPMLETLETALRHGPVSCVRGVLNGTTNYVLDRIAAGASLDEGVAEAQVLGFAEADPSPDLGGQDSADKLLILSRRAFGNRSATLPVRLQGLSAAEAEKHAAPGLRIRQVAECRPGSPPSVSLVALPEGDYLAGARGEENRLVIVAADGREWRISGKGAGRWPTAEAVLGDLLDLYAGFAAGTATA